MKKSEISIIPATMDHAKEFYGGRDIKSFKGYVALLKGRVVGIAGLSFQTEAMLLFSDLKDEMRPYKSDIWKAIGLLGEMVEKTHYPVVAVANKNEKRSEELLTKLGFSPSGQANPDGSKIFWRFPNG